jgi:hypothetical protein
MMGATSLLELPLCPPKNAAHGARRPRNRPITPGEFIFAEPPAPPCESARTIAIRGRTERATQGGTPRSGVLPIPLAVFAIRNCPSQTVRDDAKRKDQRRRCVFTACSRRDVGACSRREFGVFAVRLRASSAIERLRQSSHHVRGARSWVRSRRARHRALSSHRESSA